MEKKISINPSLIYSKTPEAIICCVVEYNEQNKPQDRILKLTNNSSFTLWDILEQGQMTLSEIHEAFENEFESYTQKEKSEIETFIKDILKLEILTEE